MVVTEFGMVTVVSRFSLKAPLPMLASGLKRTTEVIWLFLNVSL